MDLNHFIAGWVAGVFGIIIGHPMDTVKTYQQLSNIELNSTKVIRLVVKTSGIKGLYKGILFPLLCSGLLNSLYFGVYSTCLKKFQGAREYEKVYITNHGFIQDNFVAGTIAGFAQACITCPSELVKTRMQAGKAILKISTINGKLLEKPSTFLTVIDIYKKYGPRGFFVGFSPTIFRDGIGGGIYMSVYHSVRYYAHGTLQQPGSFETMLAGATAGTASWIPVVPFDTIKSRMQADDFKNRYFKGMVHCSSDLLKTSGYRGFFKGTFMIAVRAVPVNAAIIYGYELMLFLLE